MKALKSLGAVLAGIAANFLAVPIDLVFHSTGVFPPPGVEHSDGALAIAFSYRAVLAVVGGFVTARLAPAVERRRPRPPSAKACAIGAAAMWSLGHHWYPLSLIAISLPASWLGARLIRRS
jgi:hypothetical protein